MKHIIYRIDAETSNGCPYQLTTVFDDETFEVCERREISGTRSISPHIIVRRDGQQVNLLSGDFVEALDDERKARVLVAHLNEVNQVMEA
jgi:hypothetical protein